MEKIKFYKGCKRVGAGILLCAQMFAVGIMSGCSSELAPSQDNLDILSANDDSNLSNGLKKGVTQVLDVEGEKFKLVVNYSSGVDVWRINDTKTLNMEIKTKDLPKDFLCYIDNIHSDTSIISTKAQFNGIMQDTMDDHVHSSQLVGFPISDTKSYVGENKIEGQNETFIKGYGYGNQYYSSSTIGQKRYLESDFLSDGVWANKIDSVIDLIIVDKNTKEVLRCVSVDSTLGVEVNDKVTFQKDGREVTYDYDRDGSYKEVKTKVKK
jgi:hypothetical protein